MSKKIMFALLVASIAFLSATRNQESSGRIVSQKSSNSKAAQEMEVTILFSGLMVLNKKSDGDFEMGILADNAGNHHVFCVRQASASRVLCRQDLAKLEYGNRWSFTVTNPTPIPHDLVGGDGRRTQRRPDDRQGQYDFNWIIHFDGPDFHDKPLTLRRDGLLQPIIQLPKGQFFTRHKSHDFIRTKGEQPADPIPFGFVAETTGLRLTLKPGQELLLTDENKKKIFSVPYAPPHAFGTNSEVISFTNVRPHPGKDSDFHLYYDLFSNLDDSSQRYDFKRNQTYPCPDKSNPKACYPHNLVPYNEEVQKQKEFLTCCQMDCTKIYLTRLATPLR